MGSDALACLGTFRDLRDIPNFAGCCSRVLQGFSSQLISFGIFLTHTVTV